MPLETSRIQQRIDEAASRGGGRVDLPAGVHRSGALRLRTGVELHLEAGALLQFADDPGLYPIIEARWEGSVREVHSPCIHAQGETDIAVTGLGIIDGGGRRWWAAVRDEARRPEHPRPTLIGLQDCERVSIHDVTLRNSPSWTVHPARCDQVSVRGVRISNPPDSPNTDGIDPESCRNVRISDCHIDVGDDCIAVKAGTEHDTGSVACENIVISHCTMVHGHGGVVLGSEMSGDVRNVVITGCVFQSTDRGIRLKTRRGRGGVIENIRATGIVMDDVLSPVTVNSFYFCGEEGKLPHVGDHAAREVDSGTPRIRGLHLAHLTATRVRASAGHVLGLPEAPIEDLTIEDLSVTFCADAEPAIPEMAAGLEPVAREGLRLENIRGGTLSRVRVHGVDGPLVLEKDCSDLSVEVSSR